MEKAEEIMGAIAILFTLWANDGANLDWTSLGADDPW
jgi:hypothetical protein